MKTTIERTMKAGSLPAEIRGDFSADTIVHLSVKALTDENGFTPEQAADLDEALREVEEEEDFDSLPVYHGMDAYIAHLEEIK